MLDMLTESFHSLSNPVSTPFNKIIQLQKYVYFNNKLPIFILNMRISLLLLTFYLGIVVFGQKVQSINSIKAKLQVNQYDLLERFSLLQDVVVYYKNNYPDSALQYAHKQLELSKKIDNDSLLNEASCNLGRLYFSIGDYANCTKFTLDAINLSKSLQEDKKVVVMLCLMGRLHASKSEFSECYKVYEEAEKYALLAADEKLLVNIYTGVGNAKFLEKKLDEAVTFFKKCLEISSKYPDFDKESIATIYTNLGNAESSFENDLVAIDYYKKSLNIYFEIEDLYGASLTLFNIGDTYMFAEQYDSALFYFNKNLSIAKEINSKEEIYYAYFGLTNLHTRKRNFEKALEYQSLASAYKDSIQKNKYDKSVVEMQKKYEYEQSQKALKIAELEVLRAKEKEVENEITMKSNANKIIYLWIGAIAMFVVSVVIFYLYRMVSHSNKVIQKQNSEIQKYNVSMDKTLKQKEVLLKEVHHRVKNNLQIIASLLNLQMNRMENELAKEAVKESRNRVQAIALMHKGLYQDEHYNKVNVETYLLDLINQQKLFSVVNNKEINFQLEVEPILLSIDDAVPIGLILSELISNSVKHAFKDSSQDPVITIKVKQQNDSIVVSFGDNGVGLNDNFKIENSDSLGFEIVLALTEQIEGKIEIKSRKPFELDLTF